MKKNTLFILILSFILILGVALSFTIYTWPREITKSYDGIMFRAGETMPDYAEKITVKIDGYYTKRVYKSNIFSGLFFIDGLPELDLYDFSELKLYFDNGGRGSFRGLYFDIAGLKDFDIGTLYVGKDFSNILIAIPDVVSKEANSQHRHWDARDGLIVAGPCSTREEALIISSTILSDYHGNDINVH